MPVTPPGAPGPAERQAHIRGLMVELLWVRGQTAADLAAQWGVAVATVERDAAEVSRSLLRAGDEVDGARDYLISRLRTAIDSALAADDWKSLGSLFEVARKVFGIPSPDAAASVQVLVERRVGEEAGGLTDALLAVADDVCGRVGVDPGLFRARLAERVGLPLGPVTIDATNYGADEGPVRDGAGALAHEPGAGGPGADGDDR